VDRYRTNLTGLKESEIQALFMLSIPSPLKELGISEELKAALVKLSASLPDSRRGEEERVRQRFYFDSAWWQQGDERNPHLKTVHRAVWENRKILITYQPNFALEIQRLVSPYSLVAKAGVWYLVCARKSSLFVHRVSNLKDVMFSDESFARPDDFNLEAFWKTWCADYERNLSLYAVLVRVSPSFIPELIRQFGSDLRDRISQAGEPDREEWMEVVLYFQSLEAARERILGFGRGVEVLEPPALRHSIMDYARQIVNLYTS
jgi:predicted DNA-binding transcriptional regulator YafY